MGKANIEINYDRAIHLPHERYRDSHYTALSNFKAANSESSL